MKFTIIKRLKKNNRFNYTPRYYKGKDGVDERKYPTKIDAYASAYNKNDYGNNWREARIAQRNRSNGEINKTVIIVALILTLIFLFIIDFEISIFFS